MKVKEILRVSNQLETVREALHNAVTIIHLNDMRIILE